MKKPQQGTVFFDMLDAEQKENFIKEYNAQVSEYGSINKYLSCEFVDLYNFISTAFVFASTSQGHKYWDDIRKGISEQINNEKVNALLEGLESALQTIEAHTKEDAVHFICGKEFYDLMNREERTEFHEEFLRQRDSRDFDSWLADTHYETFNEFISSSFIWIYSKKGITYWAEISAKYSFNEVYETLGELNIATDGSN